MNKPATDKRRYKLNELIRVNYENDTPTASGRELHEFLEVDTPYRLWFPRMCEYGFAENTDYTPYIFVHPQNQQETTDHQLTIEMAKELCMIQRNEKGKLARQYFIKVEEAYKKTRLDLDTLSPQLQLLIQLETNQKQQARQIEATNKRIDDIGDIVSLNPVSWRDETQHLIKRISDSLGGIEHIRDIHVETYKLVEIRAGCNLKQRLTNKRRRMAEEGASKTRRDKLNRLDVIADDKKLIEIYVAIVKEMAIKYVDQKS